MNDEHATFLRAIIAQPDRDLPRLIYADALEKGDEFPPDAERAEFIRVQIELARTPRWESSECKVCGATPDSEGEIRHGRGCYRLSEDGGGEEYADENPRWSELRRRERALIGENVSREPGRVKPRYYEWCEQAGIDPMWVLTPGFEIGLEQRAADHFKRGFIESLTCSWPDFRQHAAAIMAATPLRRVRLTTEPEIRMRGRNAHSVYVRIGDRQERFIQEREQSARYQEAPFRGMLELEYPGIEFELPQLVDGIPA